MTVKNAPAGIAVSDLGVSRDWYQKLFGREPHTSPTDEVLQWAFPAGEWIRLFPSKSLAGSSSVTLVEDDFGERLTTLRAARYDIKKVVDSDSIKVAIIEDPDGNEIVFFSGRLP
jgi:glyoxylase I family protein